MIISDLNYLEAVQEEVVGGFDLGYDYSNVIFNEKLNIKKNIEQYVNLTGHTATVQSTADAYGKGTLTQVFTSTVTSPYSSSSSGVSISASS